LPLSPRSEFCLHQKWLAGAPLALYLARIEGVASGEIAGGDYGT